MKTNWFKSIAAAALAAFTFAFAPSAWAEESDAVQLWKDSPYFATCNIGAENPEDAGYYFWWGDTVGYTNTMATETADRKWISVADGKTETTFGLTYPARTTYDVPLTDLKNLDYIDDASSPCLNAAHDAAKAHWGSSWRMMTNGDLQTLLTAINNQVVTTEIVTSNGVEGMKLTGTGDYAKNSIFLPAVGFAYGATVMNYRVGGYYWSATPNSQRHNFSSWNIMFDAQGRIGGVSNYRYFGYPVRPVRDTPPPPKFAVAIASDITGGTVTADKAKAVENAKVTLTVTSAEDYEFDTLEVYKTDDPTTKVTVTDGAFTMPAYAVTVSATFVAVTPAEPEVEVEEPAAKVYPSRENGEIVLWEGEAVVYDWNDCPSLLVKGGDILQNAGAYVGQEIRFYVTPTDPNWMCSILEGYGNDIYANHCAVGCCPSWDPDCTEWDLDANGGYISFTLTKAMLDFANEYNDDTSAGVFLAGGENVIITKIALVGGDAGDTPAEQNVISFTIDTESGVTAEWSTDRETWTAYDPETAKAPEGDLYIRLTKADGGVKVVAQTLNDDSKAFDLSSEIFGWAEYLGEALDGEFIIDDLAEFKKFVSKWQALGTEGITFKLGADITLDAITTIGAINAKDGIGSDAYIANAFRGTFDGDNYTISNVILPCGDYIGFFGSTYGATIRNLKLSFGKEGCYDTDNLVANYCGATFVGVSLKTTIENCETIRTATVTNVFLEKAAGGIVGYASGGTVLKNCVNNLDVVSKKNEKAGGLVAISQDTGATETTGYGVTIDGCTNNGNVESKALNKTRVGGLLTYTDNTVTFKGLNTFTGTLIQNGGTAVQSIININNGSVVLAEDASFRVPAAYKTVNDGKAVDGLFFATVEDGVATLVKNEAAVSGADLKVMASGAPAIELNAVGDSITLDTSLATAMVTTDVDNAEILQEGNTYTVQAKVVAVESVTLDQATAELTVGGEDLTLTATVNPENATDKTVTWTSSDETVATVSGGVVTAVGVGETTITATAGDKSATCTVTVKEPEPTTVPFTLTWGGNVSAVSYTIGGETTEVADLSTGLLTIDVELDTVVTVGASAKDWYKVSTGVGDVTVNEEKTVGIETSLVDTLADVGIENLGDISVADAKEWADEKEITPAEIAACDFAYDAYLMNTDLSAKPELTIADIVEVEGGWAITVKGTAGESEIDLGNINGPLKVKTAAKLEDLETAEAIAYDIDVREEGAVIKIAGVNKNFMRAMVTK